MTLAERITIGQTWQKRRDKTEMVVWQVHRPDRMVIMEDEDGDRLKVTFRELRRFWRQKEA